MKTLLSIALILTFAASYASAQVRSEETVTTTDTTGRTTTISVTTLSKTEDITPRNDVILMSPIDFIRHYNIAYLHSFTPSIAGGGGFRVAHDLADEFNATKIGFGVNLEGRFYPAKKGVKGFYLAPNTSINWLSNNEFQPVYDPQTGRTNYQEVTTTAMAFSVGIMSGWQFFPWDEMAMGVGFGIDHNILATSDDANGSFRDYDGKTLPAVRFDIGYAW